MKKELLIIGANGALGKGVTKAFIKKDFDKIYLFDFNFNNFDLDTSVAEKIEIKDLSVEENVIDCFKKINVSKEKFYFLYSTVGGFAGGKNIWETGMDEWTRMFNMNLKSNFLIAKHFSSLVQNSAGGSICFTAAYTGLNPEAAKASYGTSKAALIYLVETLALEGKKINLSANAIAPLTIDTPANREWDKDADYSSWLKPEEIGELIYDLFRHHHHLTGNVLKLTNRKRVSAF